MHYANVLLSFQSPASPIGLINRGYQVLNELCMPIMHSKYPLLDKLVKQINHNLQADNTGIEDDNDD